MINFSVTLGTLTTAFSVTDKGGTSINLVTLIPKLEKRMNVSLAGLEARVAGNLLSGDYRVTDGARIEFVKPCGTKG